MRTTYPAHFYSLFLWPSSPNWSLGRLLEVSKSNTIKHTPNRTPLTERSARRKGRYLHHTQQTHETNIHALNGVRTRAPSNKAAAYLRLNPLNAELNPSCHLPALLGAHHIFHVSGLRVKQQGKRNQLPWLLLSSYRSVVSQAASSPTHICLGGINQNGWRTLGIRINGAALQWTRVGAKCRMKWQKPQQFSLVFRSSPVRIPGRIFVGASRNWGLQCLT